MRGVVHAPGCGIGGRDTRAGARFAGGLARRSGFTLIEVLAALLLVAIVLPAAMRGVGLAVEATARTQRHELAATLGTNKLNELIATGGWSSEAAEGDFGEDYPAYRWELIVEDWQGATVQLVELEVLWESRGSARSLSVSTLVYAGGL